MNMTKISVDRLYNLGNYEHIKYSLTVELKDGDSAEDAIIGMEKILAGLAPLKHACIKSKGELDRLAAEIERMKTMPAVDWERQYGHCTGSAADVIERYQKSLDEETAKSQAAIARARRARELFDDLGGAAQWKDAKLDWDDYNDQEEY